MIKLKHSIIIFIFVLSLLVTSCGTVYKQSFVKNTGKIDYYVLFLDSMGLFIFIFPGVIALSVDYATGTLFLTEEQEKSRNYPLEPEKIRSLVLYNKYENSPNKKI